MTPLLSPPLLAVRDLHVTFGQTEAVRGLSFNLHHGETLALVGESGSGKSATALSILRLIEREGGRIAHGSIQLAGKHPSDITTLPAAALRALRGDRIAMIFQEPMTSLNPVMTIGAQLCETLALHRNLRGRPAREAARAALERVKIPEPDRLDQYPHELSGGLRQRVMIAMALICEPEILIADEPTTALDVTTQTEILLLIAGLQEETGMAVLFITHDLGVVSEIADRVVVMKDGTKVEEGRTAEIFSTPMAAYTQELVAATPRLGEGAPPPRTEVEPVLRVEGLTTVFGGAGLFSKGKTTAAVRNVSLTLGRGETLGLVGESGCGKSTLARSIMRLVEPIAGQVELLGCRIDGLSPNALKPHRAKMQMVFQDPYASLNPMMAIRNLVTEPAFLHGMVSRRHRRVMAASLLEKVGLPAEAVDRFPHQFSGGQRQRICIARALSVSPQIIVADEAVSALDVSNARRVTDLMARLQQQEGVAFLFISHDIAVVERVSHRIAVMYQGEIVETGPTAEVLRNPQHAYTKRLLSAVPRFDRLSLSAQQTDHSELRTVDSMPA
ncbi:ABC transporter ATP-binding protein [Paracoccus alkanivorans]|uniref:ABC transporter ATP-binding protein n=1 Tax=Paracoccus alkanivorans TaxID=2116655 RepID=A0A3M0MEB2_9RHOB|nr:ABC transporter ATP-binding protein [Paracoccus alkanivorans]RMC36026.1 ABC transporter ATP-binding protein [Paracoccus alkanivorans]